jgi:DNA-directed RNA polymerase subunit RPC12/RpoP
MTEVGMYLCVLSERDVMDTLHIGPTIPEIAIAPSDVLFECPNCGKSIVIDEAAVGMIVDCPQCSAQVIVPSRPAPPAEAKQRAKSNASLLLALQKGDLRLLNEALAQGADVNAVASDGMTALMLAVQHGREDFVEALIGHGANLQAKRPDGQTALMLAEHAGQFHIVRLLWKADTKPSRQFFGLRC